METTFTRTDTKVIKGVAVLLMLMHHLFYFPDNRPYSSRRYGRPCRTLWARGWKRCWASLASSRADLFLFGGVRFVPADPAGRLPVGKAHPGGVYAVLEDLFHLYPHWVLVFPPPERLLQGDGLLPCI